MIGTNWTVPLDMALHSASSYYISPSSKVHGQSRDGKIDRNSTAIPMQDEACHMGIMICETHGRVGFVEICSHIGKEIDGNSMPHGHRLSIMGNLFVCDDCFNSLNPERFASLAKLTIYEVVAVTDGQLEAFEAAYNLIPGRRCFCLSCLGELEARNSGLQF